MMRSPGQLADNVVAKTSLLADVTPDKLPVGLLELGYCTWQPASQLSVQTAPGTTRLLLVLDGILECHTGASHTRVLPREFLRLDGTVDARLNNLSQSDPLTALDVSFAQNTQASPLATHQCYFSEDQRENKLCLVASPNGDHHRLTLNAPFDVQITKLGRYETVILENQANRPQIVVVLRGSASINTTKIEAGAPALISQDPALTITGLRRCEVIALRVLAPERANTRDYPTQ